MKDSQLLNEKLFHRINIGIVYSDAEGNPILANKAAERILGLKVDEFTKLRSEEEGFIIIDFDGNILPKEEYPSNIVLRTKKPVQDVIAGIHQLKTKHTTWILMESEPEFQEDGVTLKRILTTVTNISTQINIEKKLRFQNRLQHLITKTAKDYLGGLLDAPNVAVQNSLKELGEFLEADRAYIFEYDFKKGISNNTFEWCSEGITAHINDLQNIPISNLSEWVEQHQKRNPIHIPDVSALPDGDAIKSTLQAQSIQSLFTVPIFQENECLGFIRLDVVKKKHFFTSEEQNLLSIFAELYANMKLRIEYNKQIAESEERLLNIVNSPTHYVLRTDLTGKHTFWNKTFAETFGWLYEDKGLSEGDSLKSICGYHHKKTQEVVLACIRNPGTVHQVELDKPTREGGIMTTLWEFVCLVDVNGRPTEMQCMGIDITDKKIAEEKVRKLSRAIEQIPLTVVITNLEGNIEYANPYTFQTTGYTREELLGKNPKVLKSGETSIEEYQHLWGNITHGKEWKGIFHNRKKDGTLYWEQATIGPILNDDGEITHYIAIKEDITERKRIQDEIKDLNNHLEEKIKERTLDLENVNITLINANKEAQQANKAKIDFLSKMSHELRTPMNSILGFGQLLQMSELTPIQEKGVQHILDSGKHLLNLINEVLDISRIESGRISISVEPVDVYEVIKEITEGLQFSADQKKISLIWMPKSTLPIYVRADRQRLKQVLINLTNNAIKYNNEGGQVIITVDEKQITENGYTPIRISIEDNGWGIEEKDLEKIFIPFERVGAEKSSVEGTGLGLAVVKQLAELMGGKVGVKSIFGKGSTFWIELQQCENHLDRIQQTAALQQHEESEDSKGCILYVEDNLPNIELVEEIISTKRKAVQLIIHMSGSGVIEKIKENQPNLILLDLNLPDKHGKDILREIKADEEINKIPVIIISADAMPNQISELKSIGAVGYLTKPIEIKSFLEIVDTHINKS